MCCLLINHKYVVFRHLVRDAHQCPEEKWLIWWRFSEVVESDWRDSTWAAGKPRRPEALPPRAEGRPACRGELHVCWRLCHSVYSVFKTFIWNVLWFKMNRSCWFSNRCDKPDGPFFTCPVTCLDGKDDIPHDLQGTTHSPHCLTVRADVRLWMLTIDSCSMDAYQTMGKCSADSI